jgi:hypothetical protein
MNLVETLDYLNYTGPIYLPKDTTLTIIEDDEHD